MADLPVPPDAALAALLPADVPAEDPSAWRHPAALDVWYGVVWSRLGRGDHAWAWWDSVDAPELAPWIAAERGRVLRELALHAAAQEQDASGLAEATDVVDMAMLRLGLVADAIGLGQAEIAALRFQGATTLIDALPATPRADRQRIRRAWVAVEMSIVGAAPAGLEDLPDLDADGQLQWPGLYAAGTAFHRAKGLLFAGIARRDADLLDLAAEEAPPVLRWAVELARADRGDEDAEARAREAWREVVPPPGFEELAGRSDTARRLTSQRPVREV
jgi:hypothetical protein